MGEDKAARVGGWWWALALLLWVCAGFAVADKVTSPGREPTAVADAAHYPRLPPGAAAGTPRAFMLLIDSLREETATDPRLMPTLATMEGMRATVRSSQDAVTVPAIRAMMTGRERFTIFGFIKNFTHGRESVESVFTQWRAQGVRVAVYSDGSFAQFGADITAPRTYPGDTEDEQALQDEVVRRALDEYLSGAQDVVIAHITYSDHAAHSYGVHAPEYAAAFGRADRWVATLAQAIPAHETLVIAGDHGHTDTGRHAMGLDIPTYALYRGPRFAPVTVKGIVPITTHRAWLGWATDQAPAPTSEAPWLTQTLRGDARVIASLTPSEEAAHGLQVGRIALAGALGLSALLGLLLGSGWGLWTGRRRWWAAGGVGVAALLGASVSASLLWVGAAWSVAALISAVASAPQRAQAARWSVALSGAGLGLWLWGWGLASTRAWVHEPPMQDVQRLWGLLIIGAAALTARRGRVPWALLAAPALLLYPTVYRYGALAGIWNVALAWLLCVCVAARLPRGDGASSLEGAQAEAEAHRARKGWWAFAVGAALCWQPFSVSDAHNFAFSGWTPWVEALGPLHWYEDWLVMAACVAALLVTPGSPRRVQALAAFIAAPLLTWALAKGVGASGLHPGLSLGLIAAAAAAAAMLRPSQSATLSPHALSRVALYRVAWVSAVLLLYGHLVRVPVSMLRMGLLMLAGVVLGAALLKRLRLDDGEQAPHRVALNLFAVAASGWMTLTWSFQHLEWTQAYDWFGAAFVEDRVVLFVPLIALKYTLPVMLCRWLLQETLGPEPSATRRWLWTAASLKALAALMVSLGFAVCLPNTSIYLESVQQAAVFVIACLGLAVGAGRVREEANPDAALVR